MRMRVMACSATPWSSIRGVWPTLTPALRMAATSMCSYLEMEVSHS